MNVSEIRELFIEVLDKYQEAETDLIGEFGTNTRQEREWLENEIKEYIRKIEELLEHEDH